MKTELTSGQVHVFCFFFPVRNNAESRTNTKNPLVTKWALDQSVNYGMICSLQIIVGYSMRNLTSGEIRTDVCQSPSWHPSHGEAATTEEEAVCRDAWGSPDGCLWRSYLCCRAGVHCQIALITQIHHPKPPHTSISVSSLLERTWHIQELWKRGTREPWICFIRSTEHMNFRWLRGDFTQKFKHQKLKKCSLERKSKVSTVLDRLKHLSS